MESSGEVVLKESGRTPVSYQRSRLSTVNGKLILTNRRLIFKAGKFQSIVGSFVLSGSPSKGMVEIPLESIVKVEKGFLGTLKVYADREYTFKGIRGIEEWLFSINKAVNELSGGGTSDSKESESGTRFCPHCGKTVSQSDLYCWNCGAKLR